MLALQMWISSSEKGTWVCCKCSGHVSQLGPTSASKSRQFSGNNFTSSVFRHQVHMILQHMVSLNATLMIANGVTPNRGSRRDRPWWLWYSTYLFTVTKNSKKTFLFIYLFRLSFWVSNYRKISTKIIFRLLPIVVIFIICEKCLFSSAYFPLENCSRLKCCVSKRLCAIRQVSHFFKSVSANSRSKGDTKRFGKKSGWRNGNFFFCGRCKVDGVQCWRNSLRNA